MLMPGFKLTTSDLEYLVALVDQAGSAIMDIYQNIDVLEINQTIKADRSPQQSYKLG